MTRISLKEGVHFKGHVKVTGIDAITNKIIEVFEVDNLIVSGGYDLLASVLIGESTVSHCAVGYGTTAATSDDVGLEYQIQSRIPVTDSTRSGAICLFSTYFGTTDCNPDPSSLGWTECGLFTGLTGENMISRALFTSKILKNSTKRYYIDWTISITGG